MLINRGRGVGPARVGRGLPQGRRPGASAGPRRAQRAALTRAARVYLHAREERDRQLASTLDKMARRELRRSGGARNGGQSGTQRARGRPKGSQNGSSDHGR